MVQAKLVASGGGIDSRLTFNSDTGSNYSTRRNFNFGTDGSSNSLAHLEDLFNSGQETFFINMSISNLDSKEKLVISESIGHGGDGASNAVNSGFTLG